MRDYVMAFVGQNANGILEWWTREILKHIERAGFDTVLIDLVAPDWPKTFAALVNKQKPAFAFSFQGMGATMTNAGESPWQQLGVPFFTYMGDCPCHFPSLHWHRAPRIYLLYGCQDFYDTYCKYLKGPSVALLHPHGFPANPHAADKPWRDRPIDIVYMKSGVDPKTFSAKWPSFPRRLRSIVEDVVASALGGSDDTIPDLCAARFAAENIQWGERKELFCAIATHADLYVRAYRAARMARVLMKLPGARIYGDWNFLDRTESRARFCGKLPAADLPQLYANTKVLASVSPSVRHGVHERVMAGLLSRCAVLSDITPYARTQLADCPGYLGTDIDSADFEEQALDRLRLPDDIEQKVDISYEKASERFSLDAFVAPLLEMLTLDAFIGESAGLKTH